ncbi:lipocalin family protein [Streptomyces sp. cg35]|uniref:lipocalin family protein n=1 Tax=Streptomyces sp. cg35 TaxID=3421650 RepID=UPI003D17DD64
MRRAMACAVVALAGTAALAATPAMAATQDQSEPAPVASVDVARYTGKWYQVAAVPAPYEAQCLKNSTARYALTEAGTVSVKNSCTSYFGLTSSVKGDAKPLDTSGARLNVSFLGLNGRYAHGQDANYIVVGLDTHYQWAVVTDSKRRSGFVLSRTPRLGAEQTHAAQTALRGAGVDPCTVAYTPQDGGNTTTSPFCKG